MGESPWIICVELFNSKGPYERRELLSKRNKDFMLWEIFSLFRLQKILKVEDSLSGNHSVKSGVWLDNLLLVPQKIQKVRVINHTDCS